MLVLLLTHIPSSSSSSSSSTSSLLLSSSSTATATSITNDHIILDKIINKIIEYENDNTPLVHSLWIHYNPASRHNNAITGRMENSWQHKYGDELLRELLIKDMEKVRPLLCFPPNVFRQANLVGFTDIIKTIRNWIPKKSKIIELYGGVGNDNIKYHCYNYNYYYNYDYNYNYY